jgi:hypothetical protein
METALDAAPEAIGDVALSESVSPAPFQARVATSRA